MALPLLLVLLKGPPVSMVTLFAALAITAQLHQSSLEAFEDYAEQEKARALTQKVESRVARFEEEQFVRSYNDLVLALKAFSEKYKAQHVIDVRQVDSIKKAYRKLEKADSWFRVKDEK
jgi:hypothetical protein